MDIEKYYSNFFKGTKDPSLKAMHFFMEKLNHPEQKMKFIHIAGTNGKGSTVEMISNALINAGYKVGKYMSPHLIKYNERMSINNKNISDLELEELLNRFDVYVREYNNSNEANITLFELETALGIEYFYENNCDIVILEVGLGGTYDCTNIINPLISIITSIGYDHMDLLGNTLQEIAKNKAGIIKENSKTIFVKQEDEVNNIIINTCKEKNNKLVLIDKNDIKNYSYNENFQKFDYRNYKNIQVNLKGEKQIQNAVLSIECIELLRDLNYQISERALKDGLKNVIHHARFEKIFDNPTIIYEGGHNLPAIENFLNSLNMYYKNSEKVYIFQILKTKDYKSVLNKLITQDNSTFIFTDGNDTNKYVKKEELLQFANTVSNKNTYYMMDLKDALRFIKKEYKDKIVFILGSFYIYGDVIELLRKE